MPGCCSGAGRRAAGSGLDPTNGIWMASDHIVMAVGRDYAEIAPVDGVVLGSGRRRWTSASMSRRWSEGGGPLV